MQRWISVVVGPVLVVLGILSPALAQTAPLVGGGLAALPKVTLGPNQLKNAGFETVSGSVPTSWSTGTGLGLDQLVKHSGSFSYRATGKFTSISQPLPLKKGIYKLSGWIRTQGVGSGTTNGVRLQFDLRPTLNEWKTTDVISGTHDWTLYELGNLVVTQDTTVTIRLENYNNTAGTAWFDDIKLEEQQGSGIEVFLLQPNFRGMLFDDQPQTMRFDLTVTPPGGDFSRYRVSATLKDEATGQVVASQIYAPTASFVAELEGGAMQMGRPYLATFSLVDASTSATVGTYPAYRVSRAPAAARSAMNVAFDAKNRVLVRGVPRFVLGVYDSRSSYSTNDPFWESQLWSPTGERRMDGLKINFYLNYWYGEAPADAMKALMNNLQKHGVMYLQTGNCFDSFPAGTDFLINGADAYVRDIGAHPGLGGYYTIDECLSSLIPGAFAQYDRLRRLDPDSVTFSTNFGTPELTLWRDSADILSTDPYPLYGAQPAGGYNHGEVGEWTALTRDTVKDARPIMTVLQFFKFTAQGRFPTLAEMRNHAWMAIVEGARGLWWWSLGDNALTAVCSNTWCAERTGYMNNLKAVVNELADLEPVLLADDAPGALAGNSNPSAIHTKVKLLNGQGYVFAYNATNATVSATFRWNVAPGVVTVNAEHRSLAASGTSFTDSFGPFQAHVYVLGTGGSPGNGGGTGGGGTGGGGTPPGAPSVSFVNPASDDATVSSMTTVTLAGSAGSGSGYTYQVTVDGAIVYTGTNPSFSWNTANVANGARQLEGTVTDSSNQKGKATRKVKVANAAPPPPPPPPAPLTVSITDPLGGRTLSGTNWTVVWVTGAKGGSNVYSLTAGGRTVATFTTTSTGPVSIPWDTATVANGSQVLTASVRDSGGRTGSAKVTVTLKNAVVPPLTASITSPAAAATVKGTVRVALTSSGGTGTRTYRLAVDGALVATSASYTWDTTRLANGSHTLAVTVTDGAGRTAVASRTVTVSNPASAAGLDVFITQPLGAATVRGTAWVVLWVEGASGKSNTFTLTVDGATVGTYTTAEQGPVTIPWTTKSKPNGNHTVTASVRDATGKTGSTSITVAVRN